MGIYIREVTIPSDAEMVEDPGGDKWRASKVMLWARRDLREVETWKWLVEIGIELNNLLLGWVLLTWVGCNGYLEILKYLVENGINIHEGEESCFRQACYYGQLEIVKYLVENGANIRVRDDEGLIWACDGRGISEDKKLAIVKYLVENGADINAQEGLALKYASSVGHLEIARYLVENGAKECT
jgi:ankyrin repeat protein